MFYPLYVWKDANSAYGATFPDLPGVNTAADDLADLPAMAQEAAETMYEGEAAMPDPTSIDQWTSHADYAGGFWMLVDLDRSRINTKPVRINISLSENLLNAIDKFAETQHMTRSGFLAQAAMKAMAR
jgi:predicted RNase H-like HicB family nuclease